MQYQLGAVSGECSQTANASNEHKKAQMLDAFWQYCAVSWLHGGWPKVKQYYNIKK